MEAGQELRKGRISYDEGDLVRHNCRYLGCSNRWFDSRRNCRGVKQEYNPRIDEQLKERRSFEGILLRTLFEIPPYSTVQGYSVLLRNVPSAAAMDRRPRSFFETHHT